MIKKMEKVYIHGNQEIDIKVNFKMIIDMDMGKCTGGIAHRIKGNG
jgi:hypothetical protein